MKVKVWNDNIYPFIGNFRDQKIHIPAKEYIEMDHDQAVLFRGEFHPIERDADGQPLPRSYKMIRVEEFGHLAPEVKVNPLLCLACRYLATSDGDLKEHQKIHAGQVLHDEDAEQELKRRGRPPKSA